MNTLLRWWKASTAIEKKRLAKLSGTTYDNLRQAAGAYRTEGKLHIEADLARRIELASIKIEREGLPAVRREQLSPACSRCEFAKRCRG